MAITEIAPRMRTALRDSKPLVYFFDLWKSVLNDKIDSQADFKASLSQFNMDFDFNPGYARLAIEQGIYDINQSLHNASLTIASDVISADHALQGFHLTSGRQVSKITLRFDTTGALVATNVRVRLINNLNYDARFSHTTSQIYNLLGTISVSVPAATNGPVDFIFTQPVDVPAGYSWILVETLGITLSGACKIRYQNTDVYSGGQMDSIQDVYPLYTYQPWGGTLTQNRGDLFFLMECSGYKPSGYFISRTLDLKKSPRNTGSFQMAVDIPEGTKLQITLYSSTTGAFAGEQITYPNVSDGYVLPAGPRFWSIRADFASNAGYDQTPLIDELELYYPDDRVRFRQKGRALLHMNEDITREFVDMLRPVSINSSELDVINRVSSLGTVTVELQDTSPERLQKIVSESPLKNFRAAIYLGADVPGFCVSDLFRCFTGIVEDADITPQFRGEFYSLSLVIKNPLLDLKRKIPLPDQTGLIDFEIVAINQDAMHVMDSDMDLLRAKARIPARNVDIKSFSAGKKTAGSGSPAPSAHVVRQSNSIVNYSDGTPAPDTRITSPTELMQLLTPRCIISDGYIVIDEGSRIKYVHHDTGSSYEATWADEKLIRSGEVTNAVPIEAMGKIRLGYSDMLYDLCLCACEWDGSGEEWGKSFKKVFSYADADSADEWAPGKDLYFQVMEKNMIPVSKILGPENGYNGETLAQAIAKRQVNRYASPPLRILGAVLPISQFERGQGAIVRIVSKEVCKRHRRNISLSETVRFMITKQDYNQDRNRMIFNLIEIT